MKNIKLNKITMITKMYSKEDKIEIERLSKVCSATQEDISSIYRLYGKYTSEIIPNTRSGNITYTLWRILIDWYNINYKLFNRKEKIDTKMKSIANKLNLTIDELEYLIQKIKK